jgi:hypothetical protein
VAIIPPNHRRSLSITAHLLEESMEEMENVLNARAASGTTHTIAHFYSEAERRSLLEGIGRAHEATSQMFAALELEPTVTPEDQFIRSRLAHIYVVLHDSLSRSMKGYGILSPEAAARIDSQVTPILTIVRHLITLAAQANRDEKGTP